MKFVRACLDWRVLSGLAVVGVGVYLVAPGLLLAVLPLLLAAACPLSMLLMMRAMNREPADGMPASGATARDGEAALSQRAGGACHAAGTADQGAARR